MNGFKCWRSKSAIQTLVGNWCTIGATGARVKETKYIEVASTVAWYGGIFHLSIYYYHFVSKLIECAGPLRPEDHIHLVKFWLMIVWWQSEGVCYFGFFDLWWYWWHYHHQQELKIPSYGPLCEGEGNPALPVQQRVHISNNSHPPPHHHHCKPHHRCFS